MATILSLASLLFVSQSVYAEDTNLGYLKNRLTVYITEHYGIFPKGDLPKNELGDLAVYVVRMELGRLGFHQDTNLDNIRRFVGMVKGAESAGDRYAVSSSNAMSFFQFKEDSVKTVINRLKNWHRRHEFGAIPAWANVLERNPSSIYELQESLQAMLMMINIIEQKGSDEFLKRLIRGETTAAKPLYYKFHHTAPDQPTIALIDRLFERYFSSVV